MHFMKSAILTLTFIILSISSYARDGFRILIKLDGLTDSTLLLASYVGDKQFIVDTAYADKQHEFKFEADTLLPEGMYIIATGGKAKLFDFIVSGKQIIFIAGDKSRLPGSLVSKYDDENRILFDYINFLSAKQKQMSVLQASKKRFTPGNDSVMVVQALIDNLDDEVQRHIKGIINTNRGKFISVFLNSMQEPELPELPLLSNGKRDSIGAFIQFKAHFWDNIDLSDERVIRTPIIHSKVEQYLTKLTVPAPDSLIASVDRLFKMASTNKEAFKYLSWYLTIKFESSEIMGQDAVFVHIVDKYYDDPRISWMNKTVRENLIKRANTLRPILIGKLAPEMILIDTLQTPRSLHAVKSKYTLIYFWDPECSHCKKETPLLRNFYDEYKNIYNFEVYAVCMDTSWNAMKKYIQKNKTTWVNVNGYYSMTPDFRELYDVHSSPVMYLLDEKKTIIAKRILTDQIKTILEKKYMEDR